MKIRILIFLVVMFVLPMLAHKGNTNQIRPNILVFMTDDQSHDTLTSQFMPYTKAHIADEGINFKNGIVSCPQCCPSRAALLTGRYNRHTSVHVNKDHLFGTTVADDLHAAGYYTGLTGKFLNSWDTPEPRSGFNYWFDWMDGIIDPEFSINGISQTVQGYMPYIIKDRAIEFLDSVPADKPFFLMYTPITPHDPAPPAPEDANLYSDLAPWRPPSFNTPIINGPNWMKDNPLYTSDQIKDLDGHILSQLRCLRSIDRSIEQIMEHLKAQGKLDNTFIAFYSDNGLFWGEHGLGGKTRPYEEASVVPFAVRYPPLTATPRIETKLVMHIDITATIYALSGVTPTRKLDGLSLIPILQNTATTWRDAVLLEGWPGSFIHDGPFDPDTRSESETTEHYKAIRTEQYVFIQTDNDINELYDIKNDPYQLENLIGKAGYKKITKTLKRRLKNEFE